MRRIVLFLVFLCGGATACGASEGAAVRARMAHAASDGASAPFAPELRGTRADGSPFALSELRGAPVVLVFYRDGSCGLCRARLEALAAHEAAYDRRGARVVAVTADTPEAARRTRDALDLDFPIVSASRPSLAVWGVWPRGVPRALPADFVLDRAGRIRFRHIGRSAADRVSDAVLLTALDDMDSPSRGSR